jgi:hypothetical protein
MALGLAAQAWAFPSITMKTKAACAACHVSPAGGAELTAAGKAYGAEKKVPEAKVAGAEYVGSKKCMMCHPKQHKSWAETAHAKAFTNLKAATGEPVAAFAKAMGVELKGKAAESDACVGCHVTGFKMAGGYPAADSTKNVALAAVGCEGCHGPGSKHVTAPMAEKKKAIYGTVSAKMCMDCHTAAASPKFDYAEFKKKGVHAVAAVAPKPAAK